MKKIETEVMQNITSEVTDEMAELEQMLESEHVATSLAASEKKTYSRSRKALTGANLTARGEPFLWGMGGALVLGILKG